MDAIGNVASTIGHGLGRIFGSGGSTAPNASGNVPLNLWQKLAMGGLGAMSTVGNIMGANQRGRAINQELDLQKAIAAMTPQQLAEGINATTRPLSGALTSGVGNIVQANMAERGLSQAPGIFGENLAQALAPFQLQEQQLGEQAFLQKLGLPAEYAGRFLPYSSPTNTSGIWQQLLFGRPSLPNNPNLTPAPLSVNPYGISPGLTEDLNVSGPGGGMTPTGNDFNWLALNNMLPAGAF